MTGKVRTPIAREARRGGKDTSPIAAMVPMIAEITPTLSPMIMLLRKAGQNWS